ncbi:MAG: xylulokinase, partial [bacterium]
MILPYFIGCDLGTTATKTGLFNAEGKLIALARRNSNLIYGKDGSVIQEPYEMLGSVVETVREVMEKSKVSPREVGALALDGQMAGIMGVDEKGEPATPYDSWLDVRSTPYALLMKKKGEDLIATRSGMAPSINHGPKILWWKHEHPEVYQKIAKFTVPSCWVTQKLAGMAGAETFIDYTYLHFSCFADLERVVWDGDLMSLFEVEAEKFPRIVEPWVVVGSLQKDWAEKMGLLSGTPL